MEDSNRMTLEDRVNGFLAALDSLGDFGRSLKEDDKFINFLTKNGFFTAPASTKYHGNYEGGLYDHSYQVYKRLLELTINNGLQWQRPESPFIIGMFHDLCKIDQYVFVEDFEALSVKEYNDTITGKKKRSGHYEYNTNTLLKGHGIKSVMLLSQFINLTEEEMLCIRFHMGAYGNEEEQKVEWASLDTAIKKYPNVFWSHCSDMIASKLDGT